MGENLPVVVVGASAAGLTAVESLRSEGFSGRILLMGEEDHLPYDRPPLSKQHLTAESPEVVSLSRASTLSELEIELQLGSPASSLEVQARRVVLDDGRHVEFDQLIIATGVRPRELRQGHELGGVHTLRRLEHAAAIRAAFERRPRVVVVGGGFLGAEVAASARTLDLDVTWLFPEEEPMSEVLGQQVGGVFADRHRDAGVTIESGILVERLTGSGGVVTAVECKDGSTYQADLVVVCIGSVPNVAWLDSSGLSLSNGVDCDSYCRAAEGIYAAGDVASWLHPGSGQRVRVEHRMNATEQARVVAHNVVHGAEQAFAPVPYFWTDQYDARLQVFGFPGGADGFNVVEGGLAERKFAGTWTSAGEVVAIGGIGLPRAVRGLRPLLG
jgi:3-phenylpropionate/trans-cinnamate dioxygenase ferredoxin reductase subunit